MPDVLQQDLREFEERLSRLVALRHAIGVADSTEGLVLALCPAKVQRSKRSPYCPTSTLPSIASIHFVGALPVLVDCYPDHLMDPKSAETAVTSNGTAIVPVQPNGPVCAMDGVREIADRRSLMVIEGGPRALGAKFKRNCAGSST